MQHFNLIFLFGKDLEDNDQVLLVKKRPVTGRTVINKYNGIGGKTTELMYLSDAREVLLAAGVPKKELDRMVGKGSIIKGDEHNVHLLRLSLPWNLSKLSFHHLGPLDQYWVNMTYKVMDKLNGPDNTIMQDLHWIIPFVLDPENHYTTVINRV